MGIELGRFKGFVPQHLLQMSDRCAVSEHVRCTGVTKRVCGDVLSETGKIGASFHYSPYCIWIHLMPPAVKKKIAIVIVTDQTGANRKNVVSRKLTDSLAQGNDTVFVSFALDSD